MNSKLAKVICLVILIVMVLLTGATPVTAHAMDGASTCPASSSHENAPLPACCVTPDCPLAYSTTANLPPAPGHLTLSKVVHFVRLPASVTPQSSFDLKSPCAQNTPQSISPPPGANCLCRNSLQSEEPPLY